MKHVSTRTFFRRQLVLLSIVGWAIATLLPTGFVPHGQAQVLNTPPPVRYDPFAKIIYIGDNYADPVFAGYPSRADAPKDAISIPGLKAALDALVPPAGDLLVNQGDGNWLLKSDVVVSPTARLEMTSDAKTESDRIKWLRLDSTPNRFPAFTRLVATGGHLLFKKIKVSSWDTIVNNVDESHYDGRSYLLAQVGARMDIIESDVSYLGMGDGEPSGLSWRKRATKTDERTGATGTIYKSDIHHNYFGQYSYEAYGLIATHNKFRNSIYYGFDPHDFSMDFEVAYNEVFNNGKHGIIFSRGCERNWIHHNTVYGNAEHGIMLDRGTNKNKISDNLVYNNRDAVAIFQSSDNLIQNNILHDNERGVRINATYDVNDIFDGNSVRNVVLGNTIRTNSQYGIYLYERADKNTIVNNIIEDNAQSGVYIKTGENKLEKNQIRTNGTGVTIIGSEPYSGPPSPMPPTAPALVPAESAPGQKNLLYGNIIADNDNTGVQIKQGYDNLVGPKNPDLNPQYGNQISTNGSYGVTIDTVSVENTVTGNTIHGNVIDGVLVKGLESIENRISRNSIAANGRRGITLSNGANAGIAAPTITSASDATTITGTATPKGTVEIYRDLNGQGRVYKGSVTVDAQGNWSFPLPAGDNPQDGAITALAFDKAGNTSGFGGTASVGTAVIYEVGTGANGETTVYISGPGSAVTLPDIERALNVISPTTKLLVLEDPANKVWMSNVSLFINRGVTLTLNTDTVSWLKLRSQRGDIQLAAAEEPAAYNYKSFVTLRTYNGAILIDGATITSWDPSLNTYDTDVSDGRSYLLAKYAARMDIKNANVSYLGSADGESYGISWRDIDSSEEPHTLRTRVTGDVINSTLSNNYYGVYTFQASYMTFRGNKFHHNIGYGFDPHDYTHHVIVEDNESYENGNHGFIISRGCNNFVIRRNKSYNNRYTVGDEDRAAHGFMLDPGSPNSQFAQVPSFENVLENNEAYGNDGYGLRIVGSISNTIQLNTFTGNAQGITVEQASTGNIIKTNVISASLLHGIFVTGGSDNTTITGNTVAKSGKHGIYIKTGNNTISKNTVTDNGTVVEGVPFGAGIASLQETDAAAAAADLTLPGAQMSIAAADSSLLLEPRAISEVKSNVITQNTVARNADDGIELKSANNTQVEGNTVTENGAHGIYLSSGAGTNMLKKNVIQGNHGHGIRANGSDVFGNTWTENQVFHNWKGGIITTSSANNAIKPPTFVRDRNKVSGTATPGAKVELFSDNDGQGRYFETSVVAGADGTFEVTRSWKGGSINATVTDQDGNTSGFSLNMGFGPNMTKLYLPLVAQKKK